MAVVYKSQTCLWKFSFGSCLLRGQLNIIYLCDKNSDGFFFFWLTVNISITNYKICKHFLIELSMSLKRDTIVIFIFQSTILHSGKIQNFKNKRLQWQILIHCNCLHNRVFYCGRWLEFSRDKLWSQMWLKKNN